MVVLRILLTLISLSCIGTTWADVEVSCFPESKCVEIKEKLNSFELERDIVNAARNLGLDSSINYLNIELNNQKTKISIEVKPLIEEVFIDVPDDIDAEQILKISQIQDGVLYSENDLVAAKKRVEDWLFERGFLKPVFSYTTSKTKGSDISLKVKVNYERKLKLSKINILGEPNNITNEFLIPIRKLKRHPYSRVTFKLAVDNLLTQLKGNGFLKAKITVKDKIVPPNASVDLSIFPGQRYQFSFHGNKKIDRIDLVNVLNKSILDGSVGLERSALESFIVAYYEKQGLYKNKVKVYEKGGKNIEGDQIRTYYFQITEGSKVPIRKISFKGNILIDLKTIENLYYENGSILSTRDYLDRKYLDAFNSILKDFYLRKGFVFVDVTKAQVTLAKDESYAEVIFSIKERQQSILSEIKLEGVPDKYKEKLKKKLKNKVGKPLNVIELEKDLSRALNALRDLGFYFATITNINDDNVVTYETNYTRSKLNLKFKTGKITRLENVVLSGNKVTKDKVLRREVHLRRGDLVTPDIIKSIRDNLNGLGLFANVHVIPIVTNKLTEDKENRVNLVLQVLEKKFGRGEFAPGYRTDIGAKLSFTISKTNLLGYNDAGTLKLQLNQRFSVSQFDSRRAKEDKNRIEGSATLNYKFPHLFDFANFDGSFSVQRRRFFSFDADIFRVSPQLSKQFTRRVNGNFKYDIGLSLKYQYERIRQFDATDEEKDSATFEIGSITPGITLDFRDSPVSPRSGAYFGLNWEFANPYFGSQNNNDVEINFSKIISRNRFYIPLGSKNFVLALSAAGGMQENYADEEAGTNADGSLRTRGYIPSIKVFRLDGFDIVRGYADNEINKLDDGEDITEKRVQGRTYFVNFKFEPRYYIDDTIIVGPFFDAGRLFVDTFRPTDLRTSGGLTLKFLTPVGTLDFDYGIKLNRRGLGDGNRESFGRFHLSIGYF